MASPTTAEGTSSPKSRPPHPEAFRRKVLAYARTHTERDTSRKFGVSKVSIWKWKKLYGETKKTAKKTEQKKPDKKKPGWNFGPAHPKAVREKVVAALREGGRQSDVAKRFKLSYGTVVSWARRAGLGPRTSDPVALGNEALGIKQPNGVARRGGRPGAKAVMKAIRDLRGRGTIIESVSVEGSACTITYRVSETFEF